MKKVIITLLGCFSLSLSGITVKNGIKQKDLKVRKLFFSYEPTQFDLFVNNTPLAKGESISIPDNQLTIDYEYLWKTPIGTRKGKKRTHFNVPNGTQSVTVGFDGWDDDERIHVQGAKQIGDEQEIYAEGEIKQ